MSLVETIGRNGIEDLYCRGGYSIKQIADIYEVSAGYLYCCLKQLYGSEWKGMLRARKVEFEVKENYEERVFCAAF